MSKHTPGPWKVAKRRKSYRDGNMMYGIVGPECVSDYEDWGFTEANARLIAAAPDLLDALLSALPFVEDAADDEIYKSHRVHRVLKEIRAAIEKAGAK